MATLEQQDVDACSQTASITLEDDVVAGTGVDVGVAAADEGGSGDLGVVGEDGVRDLDLVAAFDEADDRIIAEAAGLELILVVADAADERILAAVAAQRVVAVAAVDVVVAGGAEQRVVAAIAVDEVVAISAVGGVVVGDTTVDVGIDEVIALAGKDDVGTILAVEAVVALVAVDGIGLIAPEDQVIAVAATNVV